MAEVVVQKRTLAPDWSSTGHLQVVSLTSRDDEKSAAAGKDTLSVDELLARLRAHIAALEIEPAT